MEKKKVLMLGWEFPPIINGGLGIACLGLAKAMRTHFDLSIVLPKSDPNFVVEKVELIGLNNLSIKEIKDFHSYTESYQIFDDVSIFETTILPYGEVSKSEVLNDKKTVKTVDVKTLRIENDLNSFKFGDLYGEDVIDRVKQYAHYVLQLAENKEFDIIWAHDWMTYLAGVELKKKFNKPLAIHVHATTYDRGGADARGWVYDIEKYGMEQADCIIPVSHYTGEVCVSHFGADAAKIYPVHNGVEYVNAYREEKKFPESLVLFLGRITGQKGPEMFLEIADKVLRQHKKVRFVMAGTGDMLKGIIESGAYKHIGDKFHFTGFLNKEKVNRLLAMGDIYCMPSVSEPFGLSALEAAQFGIPVILSKQSGAAEVMNGALKTDFWDVDLTADLILDLLKNPAKAEKVRQAGYDDLKLLTWENASEKIATKFHQLING
jgi:glycogen synthase